jgi:uncharacterized damage-inducible protein DinB
METAAISLDELIQDNAGSTDLWRGWFAGHADAFALPCDIFDTKTVAGLVRHIFLAELRHSQRLTGQPVVAADEVSAAPGDELFAVHNQAVTNYRSFISQATDASLQETIDIQTLSKGTVHASRRKLFVHVMLHSKRHWAQLATLLRERGTPTDWPHDFLFSQAME